MNIFFHAEMESGEDKKGNAEVRRSSLDERRKSLGLLRELTDKWESRESPEKYKRSDQEESSTVIVDVKDTNQDKEVLPPQSTLPETSKKSEGNFETIENTNKSEEGMEEISLVPLPLPPPRIKMSSMEEESQRDRLRLTLLREMAQILDSETKYTKETFRRAFLNKELLSKVFLLFDLDRDNQLVQEEWIEFLKERLTDEKQIDLAEQLESVAYVLCGDDRVSLDKFCQIFQAKGIVDKLFRLIDHDSDGTIFAAQIMEFLANVTHQRRKTGFDKSNLEWLEQLFRQTVGPEQEIRREDFKKILITKNPFFTERVFQIFDKDFSGSISLQEFVDSMHQFSGQSTEDKIKFLFKVYDLDGDGLIQHKELQHVMRACMEENGMKFSERQINDLTMALFEDADAECRGAITYESLKNQLEKHDGLLENLTISIDRWLVPPKPKTRPKSAMAKIGELRPYQLSLPYIRNNYVYLIFAAAFFLVNLILFVSRGIQYRHSNVYVIIARACGQCLNFNCMFVLVLMLRHSITFLRTRGFSSILPLDQHIYFHKLTGVCIFICSVVHTVMHILNFGLDVVYDPVLNKDNYTFVEWIFTNKPGLFGLLPGFANPTGVALFIILAVMFICSQTFVRRGGSFEIFYWTHLLYIPFWILVLIHGPNFWKWFLIPGAIYIVERLLRFSWMRTERGKTYISSGLLLHSKVTHLVIKRPPHFDFHPGDYVFVNIPVIANYEWHPFTISSAPEQDDYIWLHIRGVGEWTNRLRNYFKEQEKLTNIETENPSEVKTPEQTPKPSTNLETVPQGKIIQSSFKRKTINKPEGKPVGRLVSFKRDAGYKNEGFVSDENIHGSTDSDIHLQPTSKSTEGVNLTPPSIKSPQNKSLRLMLLQKSPLSKSLSMPDIDNRTKKRQRILVLRSYMRSESEKSFDECQIKRARLHSLGFAYLSPQNKSLAQSFRYMRNKPTIIAFKTPSLENCDAKLSALSIITHQEPGLNNMLNNQPETGERFPNGVSNENAPNTNTAINYPIGKPLEIYLDGPYGAPSSHIFRAQHAVLIATGIGVTPFASILQSIMHRYWKARQCCPNCNHTWVSQIPSTIMHLRKVDFFWINRDQKSFEWFVNLLSQLEIEQAELGGAMERFLEMHMYITSALQKTDMKAVGLQLALDLLHQKEKRDLITGLKTRTNAGRPNWDKVFKQLQDQKKGKVTVFYCGPPQLARILRLKCDQFGFSFRKEVF